MAITTKVLIESKELENVQTTQFTSSAKSLIDKFTITNISGSNASVSVNLVPFGQSPSNSNLVLKSRTLAPLETYTCPEVTGHYLDSGGYISTLASASSSLVIRCSGREIS